ncbi:hypothetical protein CBER1_06294 [Cercospora berteroae]|uniref:Uncharacterized protein n=1 Tax=Cercospora berteroae TaxID=357750 RepID=A0A2S6BSV8_9PEZI|nr:hypothetical protein CBER1_06294 [Cercospora berteroae]
MSADNGTSATEQENSRNVIGISFGNSYSSIAYTNAADGKAEVIADPDGDRQIPTVLSYVAGEEFHGAQAKAQIVRNPRNTTAFFRDFLGKSFKEIDPSANHSSAHPIEHDGGKTAAFQVQEKEVAEGQEGEKSTLSVSEVATRHIRRLAQAAGDYLGKQINAAVITVPSDFTDAQKEALTMAAKNAGIEVLQYIPEPVAALLAYDAKIQSAGESNPAQQDKVVVVADLGGTRSDIAVLASRNGIYTTLATAHDYEFGGASLDKVLVEYAAKEFLKKNKNAKDPRTNERSLSKLTLEAEAVKKALSIGQSANFSIESLIDGIDFTLTVNRTRFELLANKIFASFTRLVQGAVQKADLDILDVDQILLSGGTSHIPKIASNLQSAFPETTVVVAPSTTPSAVNPSELTARGAAIQASLISEFEPADVKENTETVVTVTPHLQNAIGIVSGDDQFSVIVPADTPAPARRTALIPVPQGGDVLIKLAEGMSEIKVTQEEKPATNGKKDDDEDDSDEDDSDDEPEEIREKVYKTGKPLAEFAIKGVKAKGQVEVQINIAADLTLTIVAKEKGGKGGVRGVIEAGKATSNGSA